jgi:hypothetical protein
VVMSTCFADFLRFREVLNICSEDIMLAEDDLRFRVRKAKNHRLGFDVWGIPRASVPLCSISFVED